MISRFTCATIAVLCAVSMSAFTITEAHATGKGSGTKSANALIASADELHLAPLEKATFRIGYKNNGATAWKASETLEVRSSARRESYLHEKSWITRIVPARLQGAVSPGIVSYAVFTVESPRAFGTYRETFMLYANGVPIKGSERKLTVVVEKKTPPQSAITAPSLLPVITAKAIAQMNNASSATQGQPIKQIKALRLIQSAQFLSIERNGKMTFRVGYKNTGTQSWTIQDRISLRASSKKESYFADPSWETGSVVKSLADPVQPGELVILSFVINAPVALGSYAETFTLFAHDTPLNGTSFSLPMEVIAPRARLASSQNGIDALAAQISEADQAAGNATAENASVRSLVVRQGIVDDISETEPLIRVGLFDAQREIVLTANKPYEVRTTDGTLFFQRTAGTLLTASYDKASGLYAVGDATASSTSPLPLRFSGSEKSANGGDDQETIFEIISYSQRPAWNPSLNDNTFRGVIEIRYAQGTSRLWIINELLLEIYLKGIAESSNGAPYEYQKALMVAARTYAKYHINRSTKYASESFTVKPTEADQVYRGYEAEKRLPTITAAVEDTRGVMVFYDGLLAITPYYSQSDGRTRNWEEVWAGSAKPWLVSKDVPSDRGKPMLGHGVGMSARGAAAMASGGKIMEEILTYFYTGVELHRRYR